jgi:twitching motility protein PilT
MQTFDQSIMGLYKQQLITMDEALRQATNPDDFKLRASGVNTSASGEWDDFEGDGEKGGGGGDLNIERL